MHRKKWVYDMNKETHERTLTFYLSYPVYNFIGGNQTMAYA